MEGQLAACASLNQYLQLRAEDGTNHDIWKLGDTSASCAPAILLANCPDKTRSIHEALRRVPWSTSLRLWDLAGSNWPCPGLSTSEGSNLQDGKKWQPQLFVRRANNCETTSEHAATWQRLSRGQTIVTPRNRKVELQIGPQIQCQKPSQY